MHYGRNIHDIIDMNRHVYREDFYGDVILWRALW